MFPDVTTI